ncbi:unnamed protein product [Cuscuta campestris]|uniref:Secreted protein n=1 Tax=Cuscuta campestris TaxID=132261 RepID=A0A484LTL0_9ASTE|nr:unnamed protein product [Cuscuta campestris]
MNVIFVIAVSSSIVLRALWHHVTATTIVTDLGGVCGNNNVDGRKQWHRKTLMVEWHNIYGGGNKDITMILCCVICCHFWNYVLI